MKRMRAGRETSATFVAFSAHQCAPTLEANRRLRSAGNETSGIGRHCFSCESGKLSLKGKLAVYAEKSGRVYTGAAGPISPGKPIIDERIDRYGRRVSQRTNRKLRSGTNKVATVIARQIILLGRHFSRSHAIARSPRFSEAK